MDDFDDDGRDDESDPFDDLQQNDDRRTGDESDGTGLDQIRNPVAASGYQDPLQAELARLQAAAGKVPVKDEFYALLQAHLDRVKEVNHESARVGNPPSATNQQLGGMRALTSDDIVVQASVARWEGNDAEVIQCTVTIGIVSPMVPDGTAPTMLARPFAYIKWGSYGVPNLLEVDIGTGRQFTVDASMVEVVVALDPLTVAQLSSNTRQVNMSGTIGFRQVGRQAPLIRTRYLDSMAQNTAQTVVVPPFAVGLLPIQMSVAAGVVQLDFVDSGGTIRYTLTIPNGTQVAPIPLTGDIVQVIVTSTGAAANHVRLPFQLAI